MTTAQLPALNAMLNSAATVLLIAGFVAIKKKRIGIHKKCMLAAFAVSVLFLTSYIVYHALHGSRRFAEPGPIRWVYYVVLFTHVVLAAAVTPMVLVTLVRALRGRIDQHKRLARWTWPIWMYVSVTGVVVYMMLYQWFPGPGG